MTEESRLQTVTTNLPITMSRKGEMAEVQTRVRLYFNGSCRTNPGIGGWGAVCKALGSDGLEKAEEVFSISQRLGKETSCNASEYLALIGGLRGILRHFKDSDTVFVEVIGVSQLVINHVKKVWRVRSETLRWYCEVAMGLVGKFGGRISFRKGTQSENREADALAKQASFSTNPGYEAGTFVLFRPCLAGFSQVRVGKGMIYATNDTACANAVYNSLIDADFLFRVKGEKMRQLEDPGNRSVCRGAGFSSNVLGILPSMRVLLRHHPGFPEREATIRNLWVVDSLPVPMHISVMEQEELMYEGLVDPSRGLKQDLLGEPYSSHPYWNTDLLLMGLSLS